MSQQTSLLIEHRWEKLASTYRFIHLALRANKEICNRINPNHSASILSQRLGRIISYSPWDQRNFHGHVLTLSATQTIIPSWRGPVRCDPRRQLRPFPVLYSHSILFPCWKVQYARSCASVGPIEKRILNPGRENILGKGEMKVWRRNKLKELSFPVLNSVSTKPWRYLEKWSYSSIFFTSAPSGLE